MAEFILGRRNQPSRSIGFVAREAPQTNDLITYTGDGHLVTFAPTGAGKTSGPVVCNALTYPGQLIVLDMKGEVYALTAQRRRAMGQAVYKLDLRDGVETDSLNPLDLAIRCGTDIAATARSFAADFVDRGAFERDRFWNDWAETMLTGAIAWLLEDEPMERRKLSTLFDLFNNDDVVYKLAVLLDEKGRVKNRAAHAAFAGFLQLSERDTRPSVLGTTQTHVRLFDSDLVRRVTDTTSIDLDGLIEGRPMSLYIVVPPTRLKGFSPLLRLWVSGILQVFTQRKVVPKEKTLLICDEVGNLGRVDALIMASTLLRSWGLTLWTFWQNAAQLQAYAEQANTIVDNAAVVQAFGFRNKRMASELAGVIGGFSADELFAMRPDEQVLLLEGIPVLCRQMRYYENRERFGAAGA